MASTFTPNVQFEEPARGDQVGVWDTPVNNNETLADLIVGGITTIGLNNSPVVLAAAQFQCKTITFNSTLTGSVTISFPSSFKKSYEIQHLCSGSSAFVINLAVTGSSATAGQTVAIPPGEICEVLNDGNNIKFKNFGRIGEYMDIAASAVPNWIGNCTVPPYLNCIGTVFSSATYPVLAAMIGTTLPDTRGRARFNLNQTTGRISAAVSFDGATLFAAGGNENYQLHSHPNVFNDAFHTHAITSGGWFGSANGATTGGAQSTPTITALMTSVSMTSVLTGAGITNANAGTGGSGNVPPGYIGGLTLIRAA